MLILNEDDAIILGALIRLFRASGESRKTWEAKLNWDEGDRFAKEIVIEALDIAFRNEASA